MLKPSVFCRVLGACAVLFQASVVYSYEGRFEADIDTRVEYNDNIFLASGEHDSVTGLILRPTISGIIKERHWSAVLDAALANSTYTDRGLDGNDQFFSLTGQYGGERNIFSLNVTHDLGSNIGSTSTDFGLVGRRVNTKKQSISPQYTRLITERLSLSLTYVYRDVDFEDVDNTTYTPYVTEMRIAGVVYALTEKDNLNVNLQDVNYTSKNDLVTYRLITSQVGVNHKFSETLSTNLSIGISRLNSTNLTTQIFDLLGRPVIVTQEIDLETRSSVYNAGLSKALETGTIGGVISRNFSSNSFGGIDRIDRFVLDYDDELSSLWRYDINIRFDDITSKSSSASSLSRSLFFFESKLYYSITKYWNAKVSYRYVLRRFKSDVSDNKAPHSNRVFIELSYNFPSLSTF